MGFLIPYFEKIALFGANIACRFFLYPLNSLNMAPGMQQNLNVSLQQMLAPQLQQSLQILQAPMLELRNLIQQELRTNPTLEEEITEPTIEDKKQEHDEFQEEFDRLAKLDEEWRDYMAQSRATPGVRRRRRSAASSFSIPSSARKRSSSICWSRCTAAT